MAIIIAAAVAAALIVFCFLCYKKAPPTQAIVVTGLGLARPKVVCGRGVFVLPVVQRADRLNMRLLKIDVKTPETGVKTKEGVSLWLDSVVTVQVYSENSTVSDDEVRAAGYDDIKKYINSRQQSAISNFLGMDEAHINEKINDVLQGNLREIVSEMTVDQILTNRKQMAVSVVENARPDLAKMGLEVVTFNVQDVKDAVDAMGHNHGVIEAIGVEQEELVKKRASIAKPRLSAMYPALSCRRHGRQRKGDRSPDCHCQAQQRAGAGKIPVEAEADKAAADAQAAGMIQTNLRAVRSRSPKQTPRSPSRKRWSIWPRRRRRSSSASWTPRFASRPMPSFTAARRRPKRKSMRLSAPPRLQSSPSSRSRGHCTGRPREAEAIRQKGLAEAEAMKQKAEATSSTMMPPLPK